MTFLWILLAVLVVVLVVFFFWRKRAGKQLFGAFGAQIDKFARNVASGDKLALYQSSVDEATEEMENARQDLIKFKGMVNTVGQQVNDDKKELARLEARVNHHLESGNEDTAANYAEQYARKEKDLKRNEEQYTTYQNQYQNTLKRIQYAKKKVDEAQARAKTLGAQLETAKIQAKMAEVARGCNVNTGALDNLHDLERGIQEDINTKLAVNEVDKDLYKDELMAIEEEEAIEKAEAKSALDLFKAKRAAAADKA